MNISRKALPTVLLAMLAGAAWMAPSLAQDKAQAKAAAQPRQQSVVERG